MSYMRVSSLSRRNFLWIAATSLAIGACGRNRQDPSGLQSENSSSSLRFHATTNAPNTLDPAKPGPFYVNLSLAYDSLIHRAPDGTFKPQLANEWRYVGSGNTEFEVVLRKDVKFSDGELLTASAVKANIEYRLDPAVGSPAASQLAGIEEIEEIDEYTLRIHLEEPQPLMPQILSHNAGRMISLQALKRPDVLSTETFGAGAYVLQPDETVHGDHYTYTPSPTYWNSDVKLWEKIVVQVTPEESSALAALQSGQLDAAAINFQTVGAARDAGLAVVGPGQPIVLGLNLIDRGGKVVPALAEAKVRQALNYAIDRQKIASALVGDSGAPTDQMSAPGHSGWNEKGYYTYDQDRAIQLLAEAGYGDGFVLPVRIARSDELVRLTQAIADELSQVGVELEITAAPGREFNQADDETNQAYGAILLGWGIEAPVRMGANFWLPDATNNTFASEDERLVALHERALVETDEERTVTDQEIVARVAELAWFLPVVVHGQSVAFDDRKVEVPWTEFVSVPNVAELRPV